MAITETIPNYIGTTSTLTDKLDNYELSTGFIYDDNNLTISVFDGNYNNLSNKPSLISITDITNTSNYVGRINTKLTTAIGGKSPTSHTHPISDITLLQNTLDGKQATLTSTNTLGIFNSTQFENVSSLIQIKSGWKPTTAGTSDAISSTNLLNSLNTTDFANVYNKIELTKNTSKYVLSTSNILVPRIMQEVIRRTMTVSYRLLNLKTSPFHQ
jgi:hypothetical protein